ncbi:MAG: hypothetical protein ABEJ95_01560 [Candidatus Nanohalobium sp.]
MDITKVSEDLADKFANNPLNFVTEEDIRVKFIELLKEELEEKKTSVNRDEFYESIDEDGKEKYEFGNSNKYKQTYWKMIRDNGGKINRIHTEVSLEEGKRIDVVIFQKDGEVDVEWVQQGSKRYSENDIDAAIELKFVKNKRHFPTKTSISDNKDMTKEEIKEQLNLEENSLYKGENSKDSDGNNSKGDIDELDGLPDDVDKYLLIFSNNNYMYQGKEPEGEEEYNGNLQVHKKVGEAAREKISNLRGDEVSILYVHPNSQNIEEDYWLNKA